MGASQSVREIHTNESLNNEDMDDTNSWVCSACTLPIFSTPFVRSSDELLLHDYCANCPEELMGQVLHPKGRLIRKANQVSSSSSCVECKRKCGSLIYECPDRGCEFQLDLLCALNITIMHRSHKHRLAVISAPASFKCGACETQHPDLSPLSYLCKGCNFWIHPDCASLPNAITSLYRHPHLLYLAYNFSTPLGVSVQGNSTCAICENVVSSSGVYFCAKCDYYAHVNCAVSDPHSFKPVLIRDAKFAGLRHFPMADEYSSVMSYIMEADTSNEVDQYEREGRQNLHPHPLIFHDHGSDVESSGVCNACVQFISFVDPFYSCPECPDFFLHRCCANLPTKLKHPNHEHALSLFPKAPNSSPSGCFKCVWCGTLSNRFGYSCNICDDYTIDVVCAMMPPSITHHSHAKSHILFTDMSFSRSYYCNTCPDFRIDVGYAQLPGTTNHKFDDHPLKLTTASFDDPGRICEICEDHITTHDDRYFFYNFNYYYYHNYYYSCSECNQNYHIECIHGFSNFKLGGTIRVTCHDCPLSLIPETTVYGYRCGYCHQVFTTRPIYEKNPAYECSNCFFRIHDECAQKCVRKS